MNYLTKSIVLSPINIIYRVSPLVAIKILFRLKQGYPLNLSSPKTYNEKIQWIKLYDHNPRMPVCCDKYMVREFVREMGCEEILNHLIWQGYNPNDIPFDLLPSKYVIKATHGSGFNLICTNSTDIDRNEVVKRCKTWMSNRYLPCYGEWFYGKVKPRIIIEEYIESDDNTQLKDYKVFCFNGQPKIIRVDENRFTKHRDYVFDCKWNYMEGKHMGHGCGDNRIEKPKCLDRLLEYAKKLSAPFRHVRVDFYVVKDRIIFGELTFTNGAGFDRFSSYGFDVEMGELLRI